MTKEFENVEKAEKKKGFFWQKKKQSTTTNAAPTADARTQAQTKEPAKEAEKKEKRGFLSKLKKKEPEVIAELPIPEIGK
eukprot:5550523-Pyramimonas_sp.AAC.2